MIVCVCLGITDRRIREEAFAGHSLEQIFQRTGAGSGCGMCKFAVARIAMEARAQADAAAVPATASDATQAA
jgi:bacterioferritin-associated ferredoxin